MNNSLLIKEILQNTKTIAMVGVSSVKEDVPNETIIRRPSNIVMKYLQEFGYKVYPVNPFSKEKLIHGEKVYGKIEDIPDKIDLVNVFRPSKETPVIAKESVKIGTKVLWLQYGIHSIESKKIAESKKILYISNKCIKQEYQKLFLKMSPVFPVAQ